MGGAPTPSVWLAPVAVEVGPGDQRLAGRDHGCVDPGSCRSPQSWRRPACGWRANTPACRRRQETWRRAGCSSVQSYAVACTDGDASRRRFLGLRASGSLRGSIPLSSTRFFAGLATRSPAPFSSEAVWGRLGLHRRRNQRRLFLAHGMRVSGRAETRGCYALRLRLRDSHISGGSTRANSAPRPHLSLFFQGLPMHLRSGPAGSAEPLAERPAS